MVMGKKPREVKAAPAGAAVVPLAIPMMAGPGAIATVIAVPELMKRTETIAGQSYHPIELFTFTMIVYFLILFPCTRVIDRAYKRIAHLGRS